MRNVLISAFSVRWFLILLLSSLSSGCALREKLYYAAPTLLPETDREMKNPGFWISQHPSPDKIVLKPAEIESLNFYIENELESTKDVTKLDSLLLGEKLVSLLENRLDHFSKREFYLRDAREANPVFYQKIMKNMNLRAIPSEIQVQFGLIVHYANQRIFPTRKGLFAKPKDIDFDKLQNSALDIGTPLAVLHKSSDGKWYYVISSRSSGWVETKKIALCTLKELRDFLGRSPFVITTKAKAGIFLNASLTEYYDYARMGVKLPLSQENDPKVIQVIIPFRKKDGALSHRAGYIKKSDVCEGYLPYTARNIIQQAFELLNAPYGWGGMYGEQDCSRFIQEVFATVGIALPRNSSAQRQVGLLIGDFDEYATEGEKLDVLIRKATGGITILYLRGHIMLFLGMLGDRSYAIHAIWAYREKVWYKDIIRVVNRVAITDLSLGKGSKKGSLLERLTTIRIISNRQR